MEYSYGIDADGSEKVVFSHQERHFLNKSLSDC